MIKRIFIGCFAFLLAICFLTPAYAAETEEISEENPVRYLSISTPEEFLKFAQDCRIDSYSQNLEVSLEADIDLGGTAFSGIPIFCGTFRGKAHTVSGVSITSDGSYQGLFRYLTSDALVRDLTVVGEITPAGTRGYVGSLAGSNAGTIEHCKFQGTVSGSDCVGGIAGINTVTGAINWCDVEGEVYGDHFIGGITGENQGIIRKSINWATINITPKQNTVNISDITLDTLTNTEATNTVTDIGGVAGLSSGVIRNCDNRGEVGYQLMGYNIGGIAGTQSGYITGSENYSAIHGRKEVGGIVGQMEPVTQIEYTEDTLQILRQQLNSMSGLVSSASGNAQSNAGQITSQIGILQDQVQTARDAVEALYPNGESGLPDTDALLAAQNTLSRTLQSMPSTMGNIASAAQSTVSGLARDLSALSGHISAMGETINNASENLGGTITDISDQDTPDLLTGKVENCRNYGPVSGDLNTGGIAGAMAMENDFDLYEDIQQYGDTSLNFDSEVRAVVLNCENNATVTGNKQNIGGLVGWHSLGLLKESTNTGNVEGEKANHVGGACGTSTGFVRSVNANCEILGDAFVGGISGSGAIVTDSLTQVKLINVREKSGNILGWKEESLTDVEDPIHGNYYVSVGDDCGAIDGISYARQAEPMELRDFLDIRGLPETFQSVKVRFQFEDGSINEISVPVGGALKSEQIPALPHKDGYRAEWKGLAETDLSNLLFDLHFSAVYEPNSRTIASDETWKDGRPLLLLEGEFTDKAEVEIQLTDHVPELKRRETLVKAWSIRCSEPGVQARLLLTDTGLADNLRLYVCQDNGEWVSREADIDGSYLVFPLSDAAVEVAVVHVESGHTTWFLSGCLIAAAVFLAIVMACKKRRPGSNENIPIS